MTFLRRRLHWLSRNPATLTQAVLAVMGLFVLNALWLNSQGTPERWAQHWREEQGSNPRESEKDTVAGVLKAQPVDRTALVRLLRRDARRVLATDRTPAGALEIEEEEEESEPEDMDRLLTTSKLPEPERALFLKYHRAMRDRTSETAAATAVELAAGTVDGSAALPMTMAGDVLRKGRDFPGALAWYEKAGALPDGVEARRQALELALIREWPDVVERLMGVEGYRAALESVDDDLAMRVAQCTRDMGALLTISFSHIREGLRHPGLVLISLLTAAVWFVSLHKGCRIPLRDWWISLLGVVLGVGSIVITLFLLLLQESRGGLTQNGLAGNDFVFYIAGVGLREEVAKLMAFLPLLPLLRKRTPGLALVSASCVGLGFALEENLNYYQSGGVTAALGRFVTANFIHLALTGLLGWALFRFLRYPKNYGSPFLAVFAAVVALHGLYDFCLSGYSQEAANLPIWILAGLAWFYFQTVRTEQGTAPQVVSAHSVFLLGSTVLLGCLLNYLVAGFGWQISFIMLGPALLSVVLLNAMFVWFLREL
ncbi:MAG: PrsW family intramembrane metalloprotease [Verrucomicrobiaceae bacterium]|nr:MAG: PrsW family intramembrane metalloprotease [Verrucomicrobiaceae bacterium]